MAERTQSPVSDNRKQSLDYFQLRAERTTGTIKRFFEDRGFGFIYADGVKERVFFNRQQLMPGVVPSAGRRVHFHLGTNERGYIAENIETEEEVGVCITYQRGWTIEF